jgi:hypothetical protein
MTVGAQHHALLEFRLNDLVAQVNPPWAAQTPPVPNSQHCVLRRRVYMVKIKANRFAFTAVGAPEFSFVLP